MGTHAHHLLHTYIYEIIILKMIMHHAVSSLIYDKCNVVFFDPADCNSSPLDLLGILELMYAKDTHAHTYCGDYK